jgi:hypothetical protein
MGNNFSPAARACRLLLADLCRAVREFLTAHSHYESSAEARFDAARRQEGEFGYDGSIGAASEVGATPECLPCACVATTRMCVCVFVLACVCLCVFASVCVCMLVFACLYL